MSKIENTIQRNYKMKIVHIFWSFTIGGAETMAIDIINQQILSGNKVSLIVINNKYSKQLLSNLLPVANVFLIKRCVGSKNPFKLIKLNTLILKLKPEIVHCHNYNLEKVLLPFFLKRSVLTIHGFNRPINGKNKYSYVVAISKVIQKDLIQKGVTNSIIINNGVNTELIARKEKFNSNLQLVCVGRLEHEIKGQDILIQAFAQILQVHANIKLNFIGEGKSEEYLKNLTKSLNIQNDVIFHGSKNRTELYTMLKDFDIMVQPSIHEGFGLTVVEGLIAGLVLVISNASGLREVTNDCMYATTVNENKPYRYYQILAKIIDQLKLNSQNYYENQKRSRIFAIRNYSINKTCLDYNRLYISLFRNKKSI